MTEKLEQVLPENIEKRSFEIITEELGDKILPEDKALLIKRVIHTSADFDYAGYHEHGAEKPSEGLRGGSSSDRRGEGNAGGD